MHSKGGGGGPRTRFDASSVVSRACELGFGGNINARVSLLLVARSLKSAICETRATLPLVNRSASSFKNKLRIPDPFTSARSRSMLAQSYAIILPPEPLIPVISIPFRNGAQTVSGSPFSHSPPPQPLGEVLL
jgi:hypothetical protein